MAHRHQGIPIDSSFRSRGITLFLALILPITGMHRLYVGRLLSGVVMTFTLGGLGLWTLIDIVQIIRGKFIDGDGDVVVDWFGEHSWMGAAALLIVLVLFLGSPRFSGVYSFTQDWSGSGGDFDNLLAPLRALTNKSQFGFEAEDGDSRLRSGIVRYRDELGREHFVTSLNQVPKQYQKLAEINPELPAINKLSTPSTELGQGLLDKLSAPAVTTKARKKIKNAKKGSFMGFLASILGFGKENSGQSGSPKSATQSSKRT